MKKVLFAVLLIAVMLTGAVAPVHGMSAAPAPFSASGSMEEFTDAFMAQSLNEMHMPGAVVVIVQDGQVVVAKGYGLADVENTTAITAQTPIQIASLAKLMTFTGVVQLAERGEIAFTDEVNQYLETPLDDAGYAPIQIHHLLTHTEGFEDRTVGIVARTENDIQPLQPFFANTTPARVVAPGEMISYGNFGAVLAGVVIERVSGQNFADYMNANLFAPIGMETSSMRAPLPADIVATMAKEYTYESGAFQAIPLVYPNVTPAGGLTSSGDDMARYMLMLLNDGEVDDQRVLSSASVQAMFAQQFTGHPDLPGTTYGFMEQFENGQRILRRDGYGTESRARVMFIPEQNLGVFVYYNVGENDLRDAFFGQFLDEFYPAPNADSPTASDSAESRFAVDGFYAAVQSDQTTYGKLQILFAGLMQITTNEDGTVTINPINFDAYAGIGRPSQWIETSAGFFVRADDGEEGQLAFKQDNGETYLFMGTGFLGAYHKLSWYEAPPFQALLAMIVLTAMLVNHILALVALLRARRNRSAAHRLVPAAWGVTLAFSVFGSALLPAMFYGIFAQGGMIAGLPAYAFGTNPIVALGGNLLWVVVLLALALTFIVVQVWRNGAQFGSAFTKFYLTFMVFAAVAYVWLVNFWNLLGNRF